MAKSNNSGVGRLLAAMRRHVQEVNDQEICRRLEILMASEKGDLPSTLLRPLFDEPGTFDPKRVPEPYTQYVKHYLYMVKRAARESQKRAEEATTSRSASAKSPGRTSRPTPRPRRAVSSAQGAV